MEFQVRANEVPGVNIIASPGDIYSQKLRKSSCEPLAGMH